MQSWIAALSIIISRVTVAEYSSNHFDNNKILDKRTLNITDTSDYALSPQLQDLYQRLGKVRQSKMRVKRDNLELTSLNLDSDMAILPQLQNRFHQEGAEEEVEVVEHSVKKRSTENLILELAIFSDQTFYDFTKSRYPGRSPVQLSKIIEDIIIAVVASVQLYFDNPSFGLNLEIKLVEITQIDSRQLQPQPDIRQYLDRFCEYQKSMVKSKSWDHALLLTGLDLHSVASGRIETGSSGMAYLSGMCSSQASCTISEARSLGSTALIIAHELAHNLGADHDGIRENRNCDIKKYIMGPKLGPGATDWSVCTTRQITEFLEMLSLYPNGKCLKTTGELDTKWNFKQLELPGKRFTGADQCRFLYGQEWSYYQGIISRSQPNSPCEAIWCRNGQNLRSPNAAALQGTTCGNNKVCYRGLCSLEREITQPSTDGGVAVTNSTKTTRNYYPTTKTTTSTSTTRRTTKKQNEIFFPESNTTLCDFFKAFGIQISGC